MLHSLSFHYLQLTTTMGKGDKRTKKGKIYRGSYGKRRPGKLKKKTPAKTSASKRAAT